MKLFYADTETTGLNPWKNEIFQFAALVVVDGNVAEEIVLRMRPERWEQVSDEALRVTGKTRNELESYDDKRKAYRSLIKTLERHVSKFDRTDKMVWVGQNPRFDTDFTRAWFKEMDDKYFGSWFYPMPADLISLAVAAKVRGIISPLNFKLESICASLGVELRAHDALEDVKATRKCFEILMSTMAVPEPAV